MGYDYDLLLRQGIVVSASGRRQADIAVRDGVIVAVDDLIAQERARVVIDVAGRFVMPGFIDPHVHMSLPVGDMVSSDDFASGTIAAACGGVTTIIDFTTQQRGVSLEQAVAARRSAADGRVAIDYALHVTVMDAGAPTLAEIGRLAQIGCPSIKVYMTYAGLMLDDDALLRVMDAAAQCNVLTLVHAENQQIVTYLAQRLLREGRTSPSSHPLARPCFAESEAVTRALALARATGAAIYIVHVSCEESLAAIAEARSAGLPVFAETCPHYLLLSDEEYSRPGFNGAKYVMTPPLRPRRNWQPLWDGLANGTLDVVATDHCPWLYETQKARGKDRFDLIPGGIAGVETRAALLFGEGVGKGRLTAERFVEVMSTNPARIFGLYPRKGTIAVGSDADLVIVDPLAEGAIEHGKLHQNVDYTVFEGWPLLGQPVLTISHGRVVARGGEFVGDAGQGRFVERSL